jgi:hypothetical protein
MVDTGTEPSGASKVCKVGVASCVLGAISGLGAFATLLVSIVVGLTNNVGNIVVLGFAGMAWIVCVGFALIGVIAGIYSFLEKDKSHVPSAIGIGINTLVLLFIIAFFTFANVIEK